MYVLSPTVTFHGTQYIENDEHLDASPRAHLDVWHLVCISSRSARGGRRWADHSADARVAVPGRVACAARRPGARRTCRAQFLRAARRARRRRRRQAEALCAEFQKQATARASRSDRERAPRCQARREMAEAADKVQSGKSGWQKFCGGVVDKLRPQEGRQGPRHHAHARWALAVEGARGGEHRRPAHRGREARAMVFGYLCGGADDERALRRSVAAYSDVELRHACCTALATPTWTCARVSLCRRSNAAVETATTARPFESRAQTSSATSTRCPSSSRRAPAAHVPRRGGGHGQGGKKHGLHMALSQLTTSTFEEVREAHPDGAKTLQLYVARPRASQGGARSGQGGRLHGARLTADFSWVGNRERDAHASPCRQTTRGARPSTRSSRQRGPSITCRACRTATRLSRGGLPRRVPRGLIAAQVSRSPHLGHPAARGGRPPARASPAPRPRLAAPRPRLRSSLSRVRAAFARCHP